MIIDSDLLTYLRQEVKDKSPQNFLEKFKRLISMDTFGKDTKKYKTIAELFGRYSNPCIMKCFFLPLVVLLFLLTNLNESLMS